ncbi:uncharacterized protein LOC144452772 [Glandiceps talaboti]
MGVLSIPPMIFLMILFNSYFTDGDQTRVLILGGGVSGIKAAETLLENGVSDFLVLEGDAQIGGRLKSMDFHGTTIHPGANWVHFAGANDNMIWTLRNEYDLVGVLSDFENFATRSERGEDVTGEAKEAAKRLSLTTDTLDRLYKKICADDCLRTMSVRSGLQYAGWNPTTAVEHVIEYFQYDAEFADPPDLTSLDSVLELLDAVPQADFFVTDTRGFDLFLRDSAEQFQDKILTNKKVKLVNWETSNDEITVTTQDGAVYTADFALCTFSIGVLESNEVEFFPPLPDWKMYEIFKFRMAWFTKIYLKFADDVIPFWDGTEWVLIASARRGYYPVIATALAEKKILLLLVTGDESRRIENQPVDDTKLEVMQMLRTLYGDLIPDPDDIYVTKWGIDHLQLGSYSNWPSEVTPECFERLKAAVGGRLYFAGEATHEKYNGYLQGAYLTGRDRASEIIACLGGREPSKKKRATSVVNDTGGLTCPLPYKPKNNIEGCTYSKANNYRVNASIDDGSYNHRILARVMEIVPEEPIKDRVPKRS